MSSESKMVLSVYEHLIEDMPYGVLVANQEGKFILWNKIAKVLFEEPLISSSLAPRWVEDFGVYTVDKTTKFKTEDLPMMRALNGEVVYNEKMVVKNARYPNGAYLKVSSYPLWEDDKVSAAVVICEDVTREQELYNSVVSKISELEQYLMEKLGMDNLDDIFIKKEINILPDGEKSVL